MLRVTAIPLVALLAMTLASPAAATDFGVRVVGQKVAMEPGLAVERAAPSTYFPGIAAAARVGASYGTVTSTYRSAAHNRAVGGVPNSYHLRGMAIDVARRAGVSHWQIAAAFRAAGYRLLESLDEGDHSHFAFAAGGTSFAAAPSVFRSNEVTRWGMVSAPRSIPVEPEAPPPLRLAADNHGELNVGAAGRGETAR